MAGREDEPQKDNSYFWDSDREADELLTSQAEEEKKGGCRRVFMGIIVILILLLLFWPVDKSKLNQQNKANKALAKNDNRAGLAKYDVISLSFVQSAINTKTNLVKVTFRLKNLSSRAQMLSYNMVSLEDKYGVSYEPDTQFTNDWYQKSKRLNPWDQMIAPKKSKTAVVFFHIFKGPKKAYFLTVRSFDWTNPQPKKIAAGTL